MTAGPTTYNRVILLDAGGTPVRRTARASAGAVGSRVGLPGVTGAPEVDVTVTPDGRYWISIRRADNTREHLSGSLIKEA